MIMTWTSGEPGAWMDATAGLGQAAPKSFVHGYAWTKQQSQPL